MWVFGFEKTLFIGIIFANEVKVQLINCDLCPSVPQVCVWWCVVFACNYIFHDNCMPQLFGNDSPQFLETGLQDCLKAQLGCWQELVTDIVILHNMHGPCHLRCMCGQLYIHPWKNAQCTHVLYVRFRSALLLQAIAHPSVNSMVVMQNVLPLTSKPFPLYRRQNLCRYGSCLLMVSLLYLLLVNQAFI